MRLSVKTPNANTHYPTVLNEDLKFPKVTNFETVNLKDED